MDVAASGPESVALPARKRRIRPKEITRSFVFTFAVVAVLAVFLSPIMRAVLVSLRTPEQVGQLDSPQYPATFATFDYQGKTYDVYDVPVDGGTHQLALVKKGRASSQFVDPAERRRRPDHVAGVVARADPGLVARRRSGRTTATCGTRSTIRACCSTPWRSR